MDEIHAEADGVPSRRVSHVVAELIFFLIAQNRESSDGCNELIVAESLESRDGAECGAEGKGQRETKIGIARFGVMKIAGAKCECPKPVGGERVLLADYRV